MNEPNYRQELDKILDGFSDTGEEACKALDYNVQAFGRDFDFLRRLLKDLDSGNLLEDKLKKGQITREGMQVAMDSLKKLPEIPYVLLIIEEMRKLLARVGIEEVEMVDPKCPKVGDTILLQLTNGEMTTNIGEVRDGFAYFHGTERRKTGFDNLRFTRNLQIGGVAGISAGEGWMILNSGEIEIVSIENPAK